MVSTYQPVEESEDHTIHMPREEGRGDQVELLEMIDGHVKDPPREGSGLALRDAVSLLVGIIVGSAIFASPGPVLLGAGSPAGALGIWVGGGAVAWMGALCFAELGSAYPQNGGEAIYLARAFGPLCGFLYEWAAVVVLRPAGSAITLRVFGDHAAELFLGEGSGGGAMSTGLAITALCAITTLHALSVRAGKGALTTLMILKLGILIILPLLGALVALGLITPGPSGYEGEPILHSFWTPIPIPEDQSEGILTALFAGLWAYDGWNGVNAVAGELSQPRRDLPRAIHITLPLLLTLYLLLNLTYFSLLPSAAFASPALALIFMRTLFGSAGATVMAGAVAISTLGAMTANVYTGAHFMRQTALAGHLPRALGHLDRRLATPVRALLVQTLPIIALLLLTGSFTVLVGACSLVAWIAYGSCAYAVIPLRRLDGMADGPYRVPFPFILIFVAVTLLLLGMGIVGEPARILGTLLILGAGWVVWRWCALQ